MSTLLSEAFRKAGIAGNKRNNNIKVVKTITQKSQPQQKQETYGTMVISMKGKILPKKSKTGNEIPKGDHIGKQIYGIFVGLSGIGFSKREVISRSECFENHLRPRNSIRSNFAGM
jgi:hypothetical protein